MKAPDPLRRMTKGRLRSRWMFHRRGVGGEGAQSDSIFDCALTRDLPQLRHRVKGHNPHTTR